MHGAWELGIDRQSKVLQPCMDGCMQMAFQMRYGYIVQETVKAKQASTQLDFKSTQMRANMIMEEQRMICSKPF